MLINDECLIRCVGGPRGEIDRRPGLCGDDPEGGREGITGKV